MAIAWPDIPPIEPLLVNVHWLQKRREEDQSGLSCKFKYRSDSSSGIGQMLKCLEACHQIKFTLGAHCVLWHHRVEGYRYRKTSVSKRGAKYVVAAPIIEDTRLRLNRSPEPRHDVGIRARTQRTVVRINELVLVIIYVCLKLLDAPTIKGIGEEKFALRATAVIDRRPGKRELHAIRYFTVSVEVHDAIKRRRATTNLARYGFRRDEPKIVDHDGPSVAESFVRAA